NLTISADIIPHLLDAGFNVLFFDYRGFGLSSGRVSLRGVVSDGITAAKFHDTIRPKNVPSVLYGFSLGGAVAAQVIRRHPFDALILQSTFTSLPQLAAVLHPRLAFLTGKVFDTVGVLKRLQVPLLVLHGKEDEVCPSWMAHELFDSCPSPQKRIHTVDGGLHKDLYLRDPDALIWAISQFVADLPHSTRTHSVEETPAIEQWTDYALRYVRGFFRKRRPATP
ncbi:MAG TPA: alpha/beta fold hydrolase, partial [Thermoanaerobaculia bacterium]|nr:alpha/beta fold hydrolase [Thermoanaerobaculia bacterium]